jgi:tetratricopeptide (TPR) repeat protein
MFNASPYLFRILLILTMLCASVQATPLQALYATLDPTSVAQHFAFYELYPKTPEGKQALRHAWDLLSRGCYDCDPELVLPSLDVQPIIALVNRSNAESIPTLTDEQLAVIDRLAGHLSNRKLLGYGLWSEAQILALQPEEIDLARGLLVAELGESADVRRSIQSYEAMMDLMALQIYARLPANATPEQKIFYINDYVFSEMRFRFPPHSLYAKEIDVYTFLPSVLDGRKGVCLGVSILYLSLAQRLDLHLEAITPPGHIYVRHVGESGKVINIETTARGVDLPSKVYLSVESKALKQRTLREVIGLAFVNQASVSWQNDDFAKAVTLYEKAGPYLPDDYLLQLFLGYNYLFLGEEAKGRSLLMPLRDRVPEENLTPDSIVADYLDGKADVQAIRAVFQSVDARRQSILDKQRQLQEVVTKWPQFRQGIMHLAVTWLQLGREKEALGVLTRVHELEPQDPLVCYYLAALHYQRHNYTQAWHYLGLAEEVLKAHHHAPEAVRQLRTMLTQACPEG